MPPGPFGLSMNTYSGYAFSVHARASSSQRHLSLKHPQAGFRPGAGFTQSCTGSPTQTPTRQSKPKTSKEQSVAKRSKAKHLQGLLSPAALLIAARRCEAPACGGTCPVAKAQKRPKRPPAQRPLLSFNCEIVQKFPFRARTGRHLLLRWPGLLNFSSIVKQAPAAAKY